MSSKQLKGFGIAQEYGSATQMFHSALEQLLNADMIAPTEGDCRELRCWVGRLQNADRNWPIAPLRNLKATYAGAEMAWYASGTANAEAIKFHAPQYPKWCEETEHGIEMYGALGHRLMRGNPGFQNEVATILDRHDTTRGQLHAAIRLLETRPNTRQCAISLWDSGDICHAIPKDKNNLPCYLSFHFTHRNGYLDMMAVMRSNDAWIGFPYDVYAFTSIQRWVAAALNYKLGSYTHVAGSLHLYEKHVEAAKKTLENGRQQWGADFIPSANEQPRYDAEAFANVEDDPCEWLTDEQTWLVSREKEARKGDRERCLGMIDNLACSLRTPTSDWATCAAVGVAIKNGWDLSELADKHKHFLSDPALELSLALEIVKGQG